MSHPFTPSKPGKVVGIDLGTTFSAIAYVDEYGKPQIIPNAENDRTTPSVILFESRKAIVGTVAQQNAVAEADKIVDFMKREMGKSEDQFHREFDGVRYSAEQLSALIIRKLKEDAEKFLGEPVTHAVITVPAYFNDAERTATVNAGRLAGLEVLQVINEPTAAALAYGLDKLGKDQTTLVFDLGGGTFDVTIMRIEGNHVRMILSNGDHRLGGKDWDDVLLRWMADEFDRTGGDNPLLDLQSYQELQSRATITKIQLSSRDRSTMIHSYNGRSVKVQVTREEFEQRSKHLVERCKTICEIVMEEAGLKWPQIDRVLLVGGMTRTPAVRQMIAELAEGVTISSDLHPDEAVAFGAAIQGTLSLLQMEEEALLNPNNALGAECQPMISPAVREQFSDERGALLRVSDVSSHTLGIVLWDEKRGEEYVFPMIPRATSVPAKAKDSFVLASPNQRVATVRVVEGESKRVGECSALGLCQIELADGLPKGTPVEVTYGYNTNQVLEILVEVNGRQSHASITRNAGLANGDLARAAADLAQVEVS